MGEGLGNLGKSKTSVMNVTKEQLKYLPAYFDVKAMETNRPSTTDFCQICEDKFRPMLNPA